MLLHRGKPTGKTTEFPFGRFVYWLIRESWEDPRELEDSELMQAVRDEFAGREVPQSIGDYRNQYCRTRPHMMGKGLPRLEGKLTQAQGKEYDEFKRRYYRRRLRKRNGIVQWPGPSSRKTSLRRNVPVGEIEQLRKARVGQNAFRAAILRNYDCRCCFPACEVDEQLLLIAAHIDRWADSTETRGKAENGLCFCALHDRAYEMGLFLIDDDLRVKVDSSRPARWPKEMLAPFQGAKIRHGTIQPSRSLLRKHRNRFKKPS